MCRSPSPPKLPNATPLPPCPKTDGGRPPLADGAGIGAGECEGSVTLGFEIEMGAEAAGCALSGMLCETFGESAIDPN